MQDVPGRFALGIPCRPVGASVEQNTDETLPPRTFQARTGPHMQGSPAPQIPRIGISASSHQRSRRLGVSIAGNKVERRKTAACRSVRVGTSGDQHPDRRCASRREWLKRVAVSGLVQGRLAVLGPHVRVGACCNKRLHNLRILVREPSRQEQRRCSYVVARTRVGAYGDQRIHALVTSRNGSPMQRRFANLVARVHIGARSDQRLQGSQPLERSSIVEGRIARLVSGVRVRTHIEQHLHRLSAPIPSSKVEGRIAPVVSCRQVGTSG